MGCVLENGPKPVSRTLQYLSTKRATSANSATIAGFYKNVEVLYKKMKLFKYPDIASRIWNCNETCFKIQLWDRNKFWPREGPSGYTKPVVDQAERTSLCTFVALQLGKCFHHTQCTRVSTCIPRGPTMGLLVHCTVRQHLDGWRKTTF